MSTTYKQAIANEESTYTPSRAQSPAADVATPFLWSLVTSVLLGSVTLIVVAALMHDDPGWFGAAARAGGWVALGALLVSWFVLSKSIRDTWWAQRETRPVGIVTESVSDAPAQERIVDRPVLVNARKQAAAAPIGIAEFVRGCELGGTAEDRWLRTISPEQLVTWRDALIDAGWAKWNSREHRHGWSLTAPASEIIANMDGGDTFDAVFDSIFRGW